MSLNCLSENHKTVSLDQRIVYHHPENNRSEEEKPPHESQRVRVGIGPSVQQIYSSPFIPPIVFNKSTPPNKPSHSSRIYA